MLTIHKSGSFTTRLSGEYVLGSFIEAGWGRQVPGMWSEMIYNRSFRPIPAYKDPTWGWLGLDQAHYNANAPFWHSGYEENDWYPIGSPTLRHTLGEETHKGKSSLLVGNPEGKLCGMAQNGIHLKAGMDYDFRIFCGPVTQRLGNDGSISGFGMNLRSAQVYPVRIRLGSQETVLEVSGDPREYHWSFRAEKDETVTLSIEFDWKGTLILAYTTLMPQDNIKGWRKDVVELLRQAHPTVIRYPGGCFVSFFDWRSSIGPRQLREPVESFYWGGLEENDVGLAEFMDLSQLCGFAPQICFNMMTQTPFDARCMVEYLNAPADVGYGRRRMLDGYAEPWNVELFECDNEPYRKWSALQYAEKCVEFIREMRQVSPEAKFMMVGYGYSPEQLVQMLEIAGQDIDFVIHRDGSPEMAARILPILRAYNEAHDRDIRMVNTEWLSPYSSPEPFEDPEIQMDYDWDGAIHNDYNKVISRHQLCWNYALNGVHRILDYISYGGDFALANFNNLVNTFGQNLVEATKDTAWLSCMGEVFAFFHRNFSPCYASPAETGNELLFGLFVRDEAGKEKLYLVNHGSAPLSCTLPEGFTRITDGLTGSGRGSFVTETDKPVQHVEPETLPQEFTIPGLSVLCLE